MPYKLLWLSALETFTVIQAKNADFFAFSVCSAGVAPCGGLQNDFFWPFMSIAQAGEIIGKAGRKKRVGIKELLDILDARD